MNLKLLPLFAGIAFLLSTNAVAEIDYNESGGRVVMEMENTESPLGRWELIAADQTGYPTGAAGNGHLEYRGPFNTSTPDQNSPLAYMFKINTPGKYFMRTRAHKRLEGNTPDKNNDAFVKMIGNFSSGDPDIPLRALTNATKMFGGSADSWGNVPELDGNGAHLINAAYEFNAGETYTFIISGRSTRFNLDRIVFSHESIDGTINGNAMRTLPESSLVTASVPEPSSCCFLLATLGSFAVRRRRSL